MTKIEKEKNGQWKGIITDFNESKANATLKTLPDKDGYIYFDIQTRRNTTHWRVKNATTTFKERLRRAAFQSGKDTSDYGSAELVFKYDRDHPHGEIGYLYRRKKPNDLLRRKSEGLALSDDILKARGYRIDPADAGDVRTAKTASLATIHAYLSTFNGWNLSQSSSINTIETTDTLTQYLDSFHDWSLEDQAHQNPETRALQNVYTTMPLPEGEHTNENISKAATSVKNADNTGISDGSRHHTKKLINNDNRRSSFDQFLKKRGATPLKDLLRPDELLLAPLPQRQSSTKSGSVDDVSTYPPEGSMLLPLTPHKVNKGTVPSQSDNLGVNPISRGELSRGYHDVADGKFVFRLRSDADRTPQEKKKEDAFFTGLNHLLLHEETYKIERFHQRLQTIFPLIKSVIIDIHSEKGTEFDRTSNCILAGWKADDSLSKLFGEIQKAAYQAYEHDRKSRQPLKPAAPVNASFSQTLLPQQRVTR